MAEPRGRPESRIRGIRCAIYTRKSSEEGLDQDFNSLHAQREACEAYVLSQRHEGWSVLRDAYDDGGFSGGSLERPALKQLLTDVDTGKVDVIVVYKIDRLTRSLLDFARIVEIFDRRNVSFVSVTQQFNTTTSMGRLTLNVLLSFAQFEREVTGERIRDKIAASKKKGMWMGGLVPLGYEAADRSLVINPKEAETIRAIFDLYLTLKSVRLLEAELRRRGLTTKLRNGLSDHNRGGRPFSRGHLYRLLANPIYVGEINHKGVRHPGQHPAIVSRDTFDAVQALLETNGRQHRVRAGASNVSRLAGLLFDEAGRKLTSTHTRKGSRRYRYYELKGARAKGATGRSETFRFPAADLEHAVIGRLIEHLRSRTWLLDAIVPTSASTLQQIMQNAADVVGRLQDAPSSVQRETLIGVIDRIELTETGECEIKLRTDAISGRAKPGDHHQWPAIPFRIPARRRTPQCGPNVCVEEAAREGPRRSNPALIKTIARGHVWFEELVTGRAKTVREIAGREGLTGRYIFRVLNFAFVAPDDVRRALEDS